MGVFGVKQIHCPKDQWTVLISNFAAGMPASWNITFHSTDGSNIDGQFLEKRSFWIFPQKPVSGKLQPKMTFERYWINSIYSISVYPTTDLIAEID